MKIDQKELSQKVRQLKNVVPPRNMTLNQGILFKNNMLMANNFELGVTAMLDVNTREEFVLPPKAIDMIEWLPDGIISIQNAGNAIIIESSCGKICFQTFPVSEFNEINTSEKTTETFVCDGDETVKAIEKILYACSTNGNKPVMGGVLFECDGEHLNFVACDGYRLAWSQIPYPDKFTAIIPKTSLQKAFSIGFKGDMSLYMGGKNNAVIKSGDYTVYTRLLTGEFINYRQMFKEYPVKIIVERAELIYSLTRSLICMDDRFHSPVILEGSGDALNISMKTSISDFNETVWLQRPVTESFKAAFNPRYLIDTLKSFDEEVMDIHYSTPAEPLIIYGNKMKALVLPVRLNN